VTQQYIAGELSLRLAQLQAAATDPERARELAELRYAAETGSRGALSAVIARALALADELCWDALGRGDAPAFSRHAALGRDLWEFGVCARLLADDPSPR